MKMILLLIYIIFLSACASPSVSQKEQLSNEASYETKEKVLIQSGNNESLIELYKTELVKKQDEEILLKLVEVYIAVGDIESASFYLDEVEVSDENVSTVTLMKGKVHLAQGEIDSAYRKIQTAMSTKDFFPEAENLMGLILAEKGDYDGARQYFLLAKKHYYSDLITKNNLAVLDLIEGNYQKVIEELSPIYLKSEADTKIMSNLVLAFAKLGKFKEVESILKEQGYKQDQIESIFLALRKVDSKLSDENDVDLKVELDPISKSKIKIIQGS